MRLLNAVTHELQEFISDESIPPYAILSHRWEDQEINRQEWMTIPTAQLEERRAYKKIKYCCAQATSDKLEWVWVDTCVATMPDARLFERRALLTVVL